MVGLSVIVPTLNSERYLAETLASIRVISDLDVQIIVVDSGSVDQTVPIARSYDALVIQYPPGSMYAAIDAGWALANREAVCYLNSDDLIRPRAFARMVKLLVDERADLAYGPCDFISEDGAFLHSFRIPSVELARAYLGVGIMPFCQQGTVFSRECVERFKLQTTLRYCGDFELFRRLACNGVKIVRSNGAPVAAFRLHSEQLSNAKRLSAAEERQLVIETSAYRVRIKRVVLRAVQVTYNLDSYAVRIWRRWTLGGGLGFSPTVRPL